MSFDDISYNFNVAKVLSILMVATGHYFGGILWIHATFALFIFAFSSGFFTSRKYQHSFNKTKFWNAKIVRLRNPIFVIDIFLLLIFLAQKRPGILTWQTLPSLIGVNGFLTWFKLTNPSPFGAGLWFFTLLLLFYTFYPLIALLNKKHSSAISFVVIFLLLTTILHHTLPIGHMLWMTMFAFILGSYSGVYVRAIHPTIFSSAAAISCLLLLSVNVLLDYNQLNYHLILIASISIIGYLLNRRLPDFVLSKLLPLSGCIIQIYFIHTYLFLKNITNVPLVDYAITMLVIVIAAYFLSKISARLSSVGG